MPRAIFNYIPKKQRKISSLSLITDITCFSNGNWIKSFGHSHFTQLRHISWRANSPPESQAPGEILRASAHILEDAEIDYISPSHQLGPENWFARDLKLKPGEHSVLFLSLRKLSLSGITFTHGIEEIVSAFNFFNLRSLKLRDCLGTNPLLELLASPSQPMRLTSFELNFTGHWIEQYELMPLARFLQSFAGLEDLFTLCSREGELIEEF